MSTDDVAPLISLSESDPVSAAAPLASRYGYERAEHIVRSAADRGERVAEVAAESDADVTISSRPDTTRPLGHVIR